MAIDQTLKGLTGNWSGTNRLNLPWLPEPVVESASTATVTERVNGQCLEIAYTWEYEGKPQEGLIILDLSSDGSKAVAFWTDSWHSANVLMLCEGTAEENGRVNIKGSYSVPDHPDWGWRTEIIPEGDKFKYLMFNVTPEGEEQWAVETEFSRA